MKKFGLLIFGLVIQSNSTTAQQIDRVVFNESNPLMGYYLKVEPLFGTIDGVSPTSLDRPTFLSVRKHYHKMSRSVPRIFAQRPSAATTVSPISAGLFVT